MPTSTVITSAFLNHAVRAADNLRIPDLPLLVPPHPLYDLTPDQLREVARRAYPDIIRQLTGREKLARVARVDYTRPTGRSDSEAGT